VLHYILDIIHEFRVMGIGKTIRFYSLILLLIRNNSK
ncbi:unnamed protein product, partial [marine sediment metagenome]